jgi:hypothetical protein
MPTNVVPTQYLSLGDDLFKPIADVQGLPIVQAMPIDPDTGHHSPFDGFEDGVGAWGGWGGSATLAQALRPFPQYSIDGIQGLAQMRDYFESVGVSNYHALQVQARKHMSQGLSFLVSYTWSKTLTDSEGMYNEFSGWTQDYYNRKADRALSINDYPHNLVISYQYELPFGPGKKFANSGVASKVVGGWSIAGIQQYQSGPPQAIMTGSNALAPYFGPNGFLMRPNVVPGVEKKSTAILNGTWDPNAAGEAGSVMNINAWTNPPAYTFGDAPRTDGAVRRFPYHNEDISIIKRTQITERVNIEFRADFLNIFNRTVFGFDAGGDQYGAVIQGTAINWGTGTFGHVTAQSNFPRELQFGLKINY